MALYEHMGFPGIDVLGNDFYSVRFSQEALAYYTLMVKQAASVVNQLGKPGLMSESHGVGGNAMLPEDFQTVHNWQMALGVTHVNQHAPFYSIRGKRKLDCPPIIGWQNPYWKFVNKPPGCPSPEPDGCSIRASERAIRWCFTPRPACRPATASFAHREEYKAEKLPARRRHCRSSSSTSTRASSRARSWTRRLTSNSAMKKSWPGTDRWQMAACVSVEWAIRWFVVPPSINIRSTTLGLLRDFVAGGGTLVSVGSAPHLLDGRPSDELSRVLRDQRPTRDRRHRPI